MSLLLVHRHPRLVKPLEWRSLPPPLVLVTVSLYGSLDSAVPHLGVDKALRLGLFLECYPVAELPALLWVCTLDPNARCDVHPP